MINSPLAETAMKNEAQLGLGAVYEKQGRLRTGAEQESLLREALSQYLGVFYEGGSDPHWRQRAGMAAGKLLEEFQQWSEATRVYSRLQDMFPPMRTVLETRINQLKELPPPNRN